MIFNLKNLVENLIITIVVLITGMAGGYYFSINSAERMVESQKSLIEAAIRKETTNITNEFKTEIKKLKVKKDGTVNLAIEPKLDNKASTHINDTRVDTIPRKKTLFKRIFGK